MTPPSTESACDRLMPTTRRDCLKHLQQMGVLALTLTSGFGMRAAAAQNAACPLHVLLIGNSRYQRNAALSNPERDVQLLEQSFTARGAHVHRLLDRTAQDMEKEIREFLARLDRQPVALWIGYSGHAVQIEGKNYLQGIDSDFSSPHKVRGHGVNLDTITGLIQRNAPAAAVVSVDACRNSPFQPERMRGAPQGLAFLEPQGLCISFSTAPYAPAMDGDAGTYSPYAQALAQALAGTEKKSLDQVLRETANTVFARTHKRQIPEYRSALRAEWWFEGQHVHLLPHNKRTANGAAVQSTHTRAVAYRPDEPTPQPAYAHATDSDWRDLDMALQTRLARTSPQAAQQLAQRHRQGKLPLQEQLLLSMLLQDGLAGLSAAPRQARQMLSPWAAQGHVYAQTLLGESWFAEQAYDHAYKWLSLAARSGFARARMNLSHMHMLGHGNADPAASALQALEAMLKETQHRLPPREQATTPSPQLLQEVERIRQGLGIGR